MVEMGDQKANKEEDILAEFEINIEILPPKEEKGQSEQQLLTDF